MPQHAASQRGLRADGTPAMTPAEFRATREMLGLSVDWIAEWAGVHERSVRKWDQGVNNVPENIAAALDQIAKATSRFVDKVASKRRLEPEFVFTVPRPKKAEADRRLDAPWGYWSMDWWWRVAGRVLDADRKHRGAFVIYVDADEGEKPTMAPPAIPSAPERDARHR